MQQARVDFTSMTPEDRIYEGLCQSGVVSGLDTLPKATALAIIRNSMTPDTLGYNMDELEALVEKALQEVAEVPAPAKGKRTRRAPAQPVSRPPALPTAPAIPTNLFRSLDIPDLDVTPTKPKHCVSFALGDMGGTLTSWYHWITETDTLVLLIYDLRFEFGTMFIPPCRDTDSQIKITIKPKNLSFDCYGNTTSFEFGSFQFVLLVKAVPEKGYVQYDGEDGRD